MRMIALVTLCCSLLFLAACAPRATISSQTPGLCKINCQQRYTSCNQLCHNSCSRCSLSSSQTTLKTYNHYKQEQCLRGGIIARELNSYRDPLQCRKTTCNCPSDYSICIQSCAGVGFFNNSR